MVRTNRQASFIFHLRSDKISHLPQEKYELCGGGDFEAGRGEGELKYEVRRTKYEVKELGAMELRRRKR